MSLFVDTSIWYAAADSSDASTARARAIRPAGEPLVTTDHVLVETWTLLRYRIRRKAAERFWEALRKSESNARLPSTMALLSSDSAQSAAGLLQFCDEIAHQNQNMILALNCTTRGELLVAVIL